MFSALRGLDMPSAAGLLAAAALRVMGDTVPGSSTIVPAQNEMVAALIQEVRENLGIKSLDDSPESRMRVVEILDQHADMIANSKASDEAIQRAALQGDLPSDLFNLTFDAGFERNWGARWKVERELALQTVKHPHQEQIFGEHPIAGHPPLISLYTRFFESKFPARSFWLLVGGQRDHLDLNVNQVWRIYPSLVDFSNISSPLEALILFAQSYGAPLTIGNVTAPYFFEGNLIELRKSKDNVEFQMKANSNELIYVTAYNQAINGKQNAYMILSININSYFKAVEGRRGWDRDLLNEIFMNNKKSNRLLFNKSQSWS